MAGVNQLFEDGLVHQVVMDRCRCDPALAVVDPTPRETATCVSCLAIEPDTFFVSLHTAEPKEMDQSANETTYTSYARVAVERSELGWSVVDSKDPPAKRVRLEFPPCTGGAGTIKFFGISPFPCGPAPLLVSGEVEPPLAVGNGVTCQLTLDFDNLFC